MKLSEDADQAYTAKDRQEEEEEKWERKVAYLESQIQDLSNNGRMERELTTARKEYEAFVGAFNICMADDRKAKEEVAFGRRRRVKQKRDGNSGRQKRHR